MEQQWVELGSKQDKEYLELLQYSRDKQLGEMEKKELIYALNDRFAVERTMLSMELESKKRRSKYRNAISKASYVPNFNLNNLDTLNTLDNLDNLGTLDDTIDTIRNDLDVDDDVHSESSESN